jgi:hypothetical protein
LLLGWKRNGELDLERVNNCVSYFILERKHAGQFAVISFCPKVETAARINQFGGNANAVTVPSQTSFKHIRDV